MFNRKDFRIQARIEHLADLISLNETGASSTKYLFSGPEGEITMPSIAEFCRSNFGTTKCGQPKYSSSFRDYLNQRRTSPVYGWTVKTV